MIKIVDVIKKLAFKEKIPRSWHRDEAMLGWENGRGGFIGDIDVYKYQLNYTCQVCGVVTWDIRHISLECFYELHEVSNKFSVTEWAQGDYKKQFYTILVCKGCRAVFMFQYLADFIDNGGKRKKEMHMDDDGYINLLVT